MVAHIIAVLFTAFVAYTAWPGSSLFSWHPTLMTLAFAAGMFEALMVFNKESSIVLSAARQTKILAHHCLQVFALVTAGVGFGIIYYNKNLNDSPHFTTWHGLIGVITLCALPLGAVGGNIVKYAGLRQMLGLKQSLGQLKIMHATGGLLGFTGVMTTMMLGLYSTWFTSQVDGVLWYLCQLCVSFMAVIVMNQVVAEYLPRTRKSAATPASARAEGKKMK